MKQNQNLIDMAAQVAGTITLHIQREMAPLRKRLDQLERRLAQLESAKTAARDDA
jgi:polyhydroxyalkanoate synthesis regulator phasin